MIYVASAATALMLGYVFWLAVFRLRHDRVRSERERTRGKHVFRRPQDRARFLLNRTFTAPPDKPEWEEPLVASLAEVPAPGTSRASSSASDAPAEAPLASSLPLR